MDVDMIRSLSSDQNQMDIMMMLQMEKLPDFCGPYSSCATITSPPSHQESPEFHPFPTPVTAFQNATALTSPPQLPPSHDSNMINGPPDHKRSSGASMAATREIIFRIAAMQPVHIDPESVKPPRRRNVRISKDPQSVAARHRRERISERIRILQRLVPGGTKMDTASMLDEAIHYVKFLKRQVQSLEQAAATHAPPQPSVGGFGALPVNGTGLLGGNVSYSPLARGWPQWAQVGGCERMFR